MACPLQLKPVPEEEWVLNDEAIAGDDTLYHRVIRRPDFTTRDLATGRRVFHPAAFRYKDDGMSTAREGALASKGQTLKDLPWDHTRYLVAAFLVLSVRGAGGGVLDSKDPDDIVTGHAHALVRTSKPPPDKVGWGPVRQAIVHDCWSIDLLSGSTEDARGQ